jgi:hypothetical protein
MRIAHLFEQSFKPLIFMINPMLEGRRRMWYRDHIAYQRWKQAWAKPAN